MMSVAASLAPEVPSTSYGGLDESLDEEITQVRAEIEKLTKRRKLLTSSLLSSTQVQERLSALPPQDPSYGSASASASHSSALESAFQQSTLNIHRLGFGVTAFPFHDPSPEVQPKNPLLGIRIDICNRKGQFDAPYYLFCIRAGGEGEGLGPVNQELRIHRHTIPALVPLPEYEKHYLPLSDEGYGGSEDSALSVDGTHQKKQDLHALVSRVRHDLVAWRLRQDAIDWMKEKLQIPVVPEAPSREEIHPDQEEPADEGAGDNGSLPDIDAPAGKLGIREFEAMGVDARQVRILWSDDRVGRIKISDQGKIEKAAVVGLEGRIANMERILTEGDATVFDLFERLQQVDLSTKQGGTKKGKRR
ncbi:hypothetical protein LTR92_001155 [Exophiala xenobiotica]|nr:hypothetical protein LTR92_001155 [Exophiala xenobiotica]